MTRFARAKGSKSSNERLPDEATPWDIMKQQLQDAQAAKQVVKEKTKSAKQLLAEKDEPFFYDKVGNPNNEWAVFEDVHQAEDKTKKIRADKLKINKKEKKKLKVAAKATVSDADNQTILEDCTAAIKKSKKNESNDAINVSSTDDDIKRNKMKKKNKKTVLNNDGTVEESGQHSKQKNKNVDKSDTELIVPANADLQSKDSGADLNSDVVKSKKKKSKKSKLNSTDASETSNDPANEVKNTEPQSSKKQKKIKINSGEQEKEENVEKTFEKMSKRQKRNQKKKNKIMGNDAVENTVGIKDPVDKVDSGGFDLQGNDWSSRVKFGKQNKGNKDASENNESEFVKGNKDGERKKDKVNKNDHGSQNESVSQNPSNLTESNIQNEGSKKRKAKARDDKEHKRRKPDAGVIKMIINGMEIEVVKYDGFPVKKEDAERLKELKQNMIIKGIPRSEINAAMKLERRKAEKALTRERKRVCFHCRKSGHNLSDCPELGRDEAGSGICFKCGSTEHTHFECKVTKGQEFRFASCFICREQGHIARQCPDNPKGLYPQGGACKLCGDVTHLRKDCPDLSKEKEETNITVDKIADNMLESLDEDGVTQRTETSSEKPKNKIVKF